MTEHPILFSAPMVRAILDGRKTQTRRICKPKVSLHESYCTRCFDAIHNCGCAFTGTPAQQDLAAGKATKQLTLASCPYGKVGDRLWVRETWMENEEHDGGFEPLYSRNTVPYFYAADFNNHCDIGPWRPSIYMPRAVSRISLEITGVRAQRLHEISTDDANAEGIKLWASQFGPMNEDPMTLAAWAIIEGTGESGPRAFFRLLWDSINGKREGCAWMDNPRVWVISFERVA